MASIKAVGCQVQPDSRPDERSIARLSQRHMLDIQQDLKCSWGYETIVLTQALWSGDWSWFKLLMMSSRRKGFENWASSASGVARDCRYSFFFFSRLFWLICRRRAQWSHQTSIFFSKYIILFWRILSPPLFNCWLANTSKLLAYGRWIYPSPSPASCIILLHGCSPSYDGQCKSHTIFQFEKWRSHSFTCTLPIAWCY